MRIEFLPSQITFKTLVIFIVFNLGFAGCFSNSNINFNGDYTEEIPNREIFDKLKGEALSDKYSDIEAVKVLYDLEAQKLYFIESSRYNFHYDFALEVLNVPYGLGTFNFSSYSSGSDRNFILATINYFPNAKLYTVEFAGSDISNENDIAFLFNKIKDKTFFGESLTLLANTSHIQKLISEKKLSIPYTTPDVVFKEQQYQSVNSGVAFGYLKRIHHIDNAVDSIGTHDIMMINENPINLPECVAIISTQFQTPLSHVNVLSHNRGMVCMMYTEAWFDVLLKKMENKLIKLTVENDTFFIEEAKLADAEKFWSKLPTHKLKKLKSDLSINYILDVKNFNYGSYQIVGSKAANFGELNLIQQRAGFKIPEVGFAIPFYFYKQHVGQKNIDSLLNILYLDSAIQHNNELLEEHLKKIRKAIKTAPIDKKLISSIENKIITNNAGYAYRFRSSTNAEDLEGFNGAGLYDSKTGILYDSAKSIERAIKDVWASTFTFRAYQERAIFNIYEPSVYMGVLVHRSFPEETANGVCITTNLYRNDFPGFVINVQIGEISVVEPGDSIICDQFVVYNTIEIGDRGDQTVTDYITFSNQNNGIPVLSERQINDLYLALGEIKTHFYSKHSSHYGYRDYSLDIEFKFDGAKGLYIKQVRPY